MKSQFNTLRATLLVIANSIGTGIFTTTGFALADLHEPGLVFFVWVLGALYSIIGVTCYQELHKIYPDSGGEYNFLSKGLHPFFGHFGGWVSLVAGFSAPIAASSMGFSLYLQKAFGPFMSPVLLSTLVLFAIFIFHGFYSQTGFKLHDRFVWGKILGMLVLIAAAAFWAPWTVSVPWLPQTVLNPQAGQVQAVANSFFWIAYAYTGWNAVYYIASEVGGGSESVKKASYLGTLGVCGIYLALNFILLFSIDTSILRGSPEVVGTFLTEIFGDRAGQWLSVLIAFGLVSTASALFITGPRVYVRMAQDGVLPKLFAVSHGMVPKNAILLQGGLALFFLWSAQFEVILKFVGFALTFCSILSVLVILRVSKNYLLKALAIVFCGCSSFLLLKAIPDNQGVMVAVMGLLLVSAVSFFLGKKR